VKILTVDWEKAKSWSLQTYKASGGYSALPKALKMHPQQIVDEVVKANLRGRGGAGFPTGMKWNFVRKETSFPKYLVVNADEGEPGTFKDREILLRSPHMFIEGLIIGCFAIECHLSYVYCRGEFREGPVRRLQDAVDEAYQKGYLGKKILQSGFDLEIHVVIGAGAYICG
jgi:NADH-quinone oxidoreductase subunit F